MGQEEEGGVDSGEERARIAAEPYDHRVLLRPAEGSARPSARYKVKWKNNLLVVAGNSRSSSSNKVSGASLDSLFFSSYSNIQQQNVGSWVSLNLHSGFFQHVPPKNMTTCL